MIEGSELKAVAGDDANRAQQDQAAGGAEKSADHGIRHIADRAPHPRHAEAAQHDAGGDAGEAKRDENRGERRSRRIGDRHPFDQR